MSLIENQGTSYFPKGQAEKLSRSYVELAARSNFFRDRSESRPLYGDLESRAYLHNTAENRYSSSVSSQPTRKRFPELVLSGDLHKNLQVRSEGDLTTLYIGDIDVVSYSQTDVARDGPKIQLQEADLSGFIYLNSDFFQNFTQKQNPNSDMLNLSKTFFKVDGLNYVGLVQYLFEDGASSEHYHTLDESIVQLAGKSYVRLSPIDNDMDYNEMQLSQGDILHIPPNTNHMVTSWKTGSLTVPIKRTLAKRSDHFPTIKSNERLTFEVEDILLSPFESGFGEMATLRKYFESLCAEEKVRFQEVFGRY